MTWCPHCGRPMAEHEGVDKQGNVVIYVCTAQAGTGSYTDRYPKETK